MTVESAMTERWGRGDQAEWYTLMDSSTQGLRQDSRLAVSLGYIVTPCYKQEAMYNFNCLVALLWKVSKTWSAVPKRKTKHTCCVGSLWRRASGALGFHDHMNFKTTSNGAQQIYPVISKVKQIIYLFAISVTVADMQMMWETSGIRWGPLSWCLLDPIVWSSPPLWVEALVYRVETGG